MCTVYTRRGQYAPLRDCDAVTPSSRTPPCHTWCAYRARNSFCHGSRTSQRYNTPVQATRALRNLQSPTFCSHTFILQAEEDALGPSTSEKATLDAVTPQAEPVVKRKKRPKGPNPLSVKKKVPKTTVATATRVGKADVGSKRKRQEADDIGGVSAGSQPKPKRRRRHKAPSRAAEGSK
jgi:hypothetical protein